MHSYINYITRTMSAFVDVVGGLKFGLTQTLFVVPVNSTY